MNRSIVFIDQNVENYRKLAAGFDPSVEVVFLNADEDGVRQIAQYLEERSNIDAVHVVSHGEPAGLQLGSSQLSAFTLSSYETLLSQIGTSLSDDADILLYGCNVASGPEGRAFVANLAALTGADVAASDDLTGALGNGGDADLEVQVGNVTSNNILNSKLLCQYDVTLGHSGYEIVNLAIEHIGEEYYWTQRPNGTYVVADYDDQNYGLGANGGWDCAEFVTYCAYQAYGVQLGLIFPDSDINAVVGGIKNEANSGASTGIYGWYDYALDSRGVYQVSLSDARNIAGAILIALPGGGVEPGHVAISMGDGRIIHATAPISGDYYYSDGSIARAAQPDGLPPIGVDVGDVLIGSSFNWNNSNYIAVLIDGIDYGGESLPDLDVQDSGDSYPPYLSSSSVAQGENVTLTYRLSNWGPGSADASTTGIYRSSNSTISTYDDLITTASDASLGAIQGRWETATFSTSGWVPGTYYIGAIADYNDAILETDESNNPSSGVVLTVTAPVTAPEIVVTYGGNNVADGDSSPSVAEGTDFGSVTRGGSPVQHAFVVFNNGSGTLTLGTPQLPSGFSLVEGLSSSIAPGSYDTFTVQLNTSTVGSFSSDISFATNDSDENPYNFRVTGTVTAPAASPEIVVTYGGNNVADGDNSPSLAEGTDFGSVTWGSAPVQHAFVVFNSGSGTLTLGTPQLPSGFSLVEGLSSSIAPGDYDTFTIQLDTSTVGSFSSAISFTTNDSDENPYNFRISGTVVAPAEPVFSISPAMQSINEGDNGTTNVVFSISYTGVLTETTTLQWYFPVTSGFDLADFTGANNGDLTFQPGGATSQQVLVAVNGDTTVELDESFTISILNPSSGHVDSTASQATVTIANDDVAVGSVAISDAAVAEGDGGTSVMTFTVTRSGGTAAFTIDYRTADVGASAGSDYVGGSGTLAFGVGVNTQTISITINADVNIEPDEAFNVFLLNPSNGANISRGTGIGIIQNDDAFTEGSDTLVLSVPDQVWHALGGDDRITGSSGNDTVFGDGGNDRIDGAGGSDTAAYSEFKSRYTLAAFGGTTAVLTTGADGRDRLTNVENLQFSDQTVSTASVAAFAALEYIASYGDLIGALGTNAQAGFDQYVENGFAEGRTIRFDGFEYIASWGDLLANLPGTADAGARHYIENGHAEGRGTNLFDGLAYIASYGDLISGLGNDASAGARHYVEQGFHEGRAISFNALTYIASHGDLITALGTNAAAGAAHFIANGYAEGRNPAAFDARLYLGAYGDLRAALGGDQAGATLHYIQTGYREGRSPAAFNPLEYIASYGDLIDSMGANAAAGLSHFLDNGFSEGRGDTFDTRLYLGAYGDLRAAFGTDITAAVTHYIQAGYYEGRTPLAFDPLEYIASYGDLIDGLGANTAAGLAHFLSNGFSEGRGDTFNGLEYIASHGDLIDAFGTNATEGTTHFIEHGYHEGRSATSFEAYSYLASNTDLVQVFGGDTTAAMRHFIEHGYHEGRSTNGFNAYGYLASNTDLIPTIGDDPVGAARHYALSGFAGGRSTDSFDAIEYIASNTDLITALGANAGAGAQHYVQFGYSEGRHTASFNGLDYIATYGDLIGAFGANDDAGAEHYAQFGYREGRQIDFNGLEYIASWGDLMNAFGANETAGAEHFISHGHTEGRATALFAATQYLANYADLQAAFGDDRIAAAAHYIEHGRFEGRTDADMGALLHRFIGTGGDNTMVVGAGDTMTGNGGNDTFVFQDILSAAATITDFSAGDRLSVDAATVRWGLVPGHEAPLENVSNLASYVSGRSTGVFLFDTGAHTLYWDPTAGDTSDAVALVHLDGVGALTANDMVLA